MISLSFICMLIGHFLGDYYFQFKCMADKKKENIWWLCLHSGIYSATVALCLIFFNKPVYLLFCLVIGVSHFVIDYLKIKLDKKYSKKWIGLSVLMADQFIHIAILFGFSFLFLDQNWLGNQVFDYFYNSYLHFTLPIELTLTYMLSAIFLIKPAAVIIKQITVIIFPKSVDKNVDNAGAIIGILERLIIYVCIVSFNWFEIILVMLTAKTIVRYKKFEVKNGKVEIDTDDSFAEKFLVGTLASILFVVLFIGITFYMKWRFTVS